MEIRRILSAIIGIAQGVIGVLFGVLAVMLVLNLIEVQTVFNVPPELLPLYLLILGLFSVFSIISGFFLIREWRGIT
jgi:membrane associated rhomboid family serine protease